jgi:hypothetical protein
MGWDMYVDVYGKVDPQGTHLTRLEERGGTVSITIQKMAWKHHDEHPDHSLQIEHPHGH